MARQLASPRERFTVNETPKVHLLEHKKHLEEETSSVVLAIVKCISVLLLFVLLLTSVSISKFAYISVGLGLNSSLTYDDCSSSKLSECNGPASFVILTLMLMIPQFLSFSRAFCMSAFRNSEPWPSKAAIFWGIVCSILEVGGLCLFTFGVAVNDELPSRTAVFMSGVFLLPAFWQFAKYMKRLFERDRLAAATHDGYISYHTFDDMQMLDEEGSTVKPKWYHVLFSLVAALSSLGGILLYVTLGHGSIVEKVSVPLSLLMLSFAWCPKFRKLQIRASESSSRLGVNKEDLYQSEDQERFEWEKIRVKTARERSVVICSFLKLLLTPFIALLCVKLCTNMNIKRLTHGLEALKESSALVMALVAQTMCGVVAHIVGYLACSIGLQRLCYALPLTIAMPLCVLLLKLVDSPSICAALTFFPCDDYEKELTITLILAGLFWSSQFLSMVVQIWKAQDFLMAREETLFWLPTFDGIFVEQSLMLNRKNDFTDEYYVDYHNLVKKSVIYICTTMYHEADFEMEQLLQSLARIDTARKEAQRQFESHIFLDDGAIGETVKKYALQLLSLVEITLNVQVSHAMKMETPYGMQLKWRLPGGMPFVLHLKDNLKVKNKKRWSQVMYMSYILDFKQDKDMDDLTYILTTDADVKFTPNDVIALMDLMSRNPSVGAVCGRTHPIGSGPMVWYQIFDYAVGHWLLKAAEDILGTVLCSPGCFSVYRARALRDVLPLYSSGVDCAMDFLTKDMGEDRWLCTLMVEAGWRLNYCATAENFTYCPDNFNEFFKQRRRWSPSTLANQILLIKESKKIRENNDLISFPFIIYEVITMLSTIIGPSTVLLVIAGGLEYAYPNSIDLVAVIVVLIIVILLYTLICLKAPDEVQLTTAKILTFLFAVVMAVTIVGILLQTVEDIGNLVERVAYEKRIAHMNSSALSLSGPSLGNGTIPTIRPTMTTMKPPPKEELLLLPTTWFLLGLIGLFILTALLHGFEFVALVHGLWYFLCLPSGFLLLTIYSVANLTDRSWGTREDKPSGGQAGGGFGETMKTFFRYWCWCCVPPGMRPGDDEMVQKKSAGKKGDETAQSEEAPSQAVVIEDKGDSDFSGDEAPAEATAPFMDGDSREPLIDIADTSPEVTGLGRALPDPPLRSALKKPGTKKAVARSGFDASDSSSWGSSSGFRFPGQQRVQFSASLPRLHASTPVEEWLSGPYKQYIGNFKEHGYDNVSFISGMKEKDLIEIGITNRGFRKKMLFQIQCLPPDEIAEEVPDNVEEWLANLGLEEYWPSLEQNSYTEPKDLADLKFMDKQSLALTFNMEKEGHLQKFIRALRKLQYPTAAQLRIRRAKKDIEKVPVKSLERDNGDDGEEFLFWSDLRNMCLLPEQAAFGQSEGLKEKLGEMRDNALLVLAVSNILWLTFMGTVMNQGSKLAVFGTSFASVAFLFVYAIVLIAQFVTMILHRVGTWIHEIARAPFLPGKFHRNWSFKDDELPPEPSLEKLEEIRRRRRMRTGSGTPRSQGSVPHSPATSQQSLDTLPSQV